MCSLKLLIVTLVLPALIGAGPYPNFHSELELQLINTEKDWWETGSLYQIYPRSFKDSDGDGIGDIKGITEKLPHLKEIGVTATWLSPIFKSPMADFGYDISDFYSIQPEYGTLDDFKEMVAVAKNLGVKIILDFVPNHSSDECEWFQKSVKREGIYEDYYVWHDGYPDEKNSSNRLPPTNWVSVFRGPAWTFHPVRKQFYLHQFLSKQPDLNFRNPVVVQEMKNVLTYWMNLDVAGFRIDAVNHLFESDKNASGDYPDEPRTGWTDDPNDYGYVDHIYTKDLPEVIDMVYQWREVTDNFQKEHGGDTRIILTEAYASIETLMKYYGNGTHEGSHIPFNFLFIGDLDGGSRAYDYVRIVNSWMNAMPVGRTANWVLGNHDKSRVGSRFGPEKIDLLNMLMMVLPGATVTYNGEEIGMTDVYISWDDTIDPQACNTNKDIYLMFTRDPERTPFQWDDTTSAGFSTSRNTWLPVAENYREVNVKKEKTITKSHLHTYIKAKEARSTRTMQYGDFRIDALNFDVLAIVRKLASEPTYIYVANTGTRFNRADLSRLDNLPQTLEVVVSSLTSPRRIGESVNTKEIVLLPNEALILRTKTTAATFFGYFYYGSD